MQKQNKIVLFDIDHTIFNTELYLKNLYKKLSNELGFEDTEEFDKITKDIYSKIRKRTKYLPPDVFLDQILPHAKKPTSLKKLQNVFWDKKIFESSMYPDVSNTFDYLKKNKILIGIFSTGDHSHQSVKIESLKDYLAQKHIYISKDKFKIIKDTIPSYKNSQAYILDDLPEILHEVKNHNKEFTTILIKRESNSRKIITPPNFNPDAEITNLGQLIDIIENEK